MVDQADVNTILKLAADLVGKAESLGVTLRITGEPMQPLCMGNQRHVIDAWPARVLPIGQQGAGTPEHHEKIAKARRAATDQLIAHTFNRWLSQPTPLIQRTRSG